MLLLPTGCATHADRLHSVREAFYEADFDQAQALLDKQLQRARDDVDVLSLEKSMVLLGRGEAAAAERLLRDVRDHFDYLEQKSLSETSLALLTDDQTLAYAGEDYEKVLIRAFLALANLMHDGGDAGAYCLQLVDKQAQLIATAERPDGTNPKAGYPRVALAPYLRAVLLEETHGNLDDVARYRQRVVEWAPGFAPGPADLQRARFGRHSAPGHGVLHIFALVGRGPYKDVVEEVPTTAALTMAQAILAATGDRTLGPVVAPVKVPQVMIPPNSIGALAVSVDGSPHGFTNTITDVGQLAASQYASTFPQVVARAVVRRVVKEASVLAAKESLGAKRGSWQSVVFELAGTAWQSTENADTRCWGLLPDRIQVLRVELPAGRHEVRFQSLDQDGVPSGPPAAQPVAIHDGRNTYALVTCPDTQPVGQILVAPW